VPMRPLRKADLVVQSVRRLLHVGAADHLLKLLQKQHPADLADGLVSLGEGDRRACFDLLVARDPALAVKVLTHLDPRAAAAMLAERPIDELARLLQDLHADEVARLLRHLPRRTGEAVRERLQRRSEVDYLLARDERTAGRIMNPRVFALPETATAGDAVAALQRSAGVETVFYVYVIDAAGRLVGVTSLRRLLLVPPSTPLGEMMEREVVWVDVDTAQEEVARLVAAYKLLAIPVVDHDHRLVGSVTVDDVIDVIADETTKEFQRLGGLEALDDPYLRTPFWTLVKKRARWLVFLFLGEMLTATAMGYFEQEIARAVVLALFVPLVISSGGNSGSQAASLMIRALAVGEVTVRDWWRVMRREARSGFVLGTLLGSVGLLRVTAWQYFFGLYGEHWWLVGVTVMLSLVGVVLWGTLIGALLPFLMRAIGADPATSSAPFVATLVDVTGLVIYFSVAALVLRGTLL
jgi:magnesium transporter